MSWTGTRSTVPLLRKGSLSGHGRAARIGLLPAGLCLVLSRRSRSRDHHGFRGCRPQGSVCSKRASGLLLEAVRANVVTTTIVPAGGDRYIGVNYFSRPSDTLLGILAGLEQIMRAGSEEHLRIWRWRRARTSGRLLVAEYREDLKRAISELAGALQPFDDRTASTALLCDVTAPRSAATDTRAERQALRHQRVRLRNFRARHTAGGDRPGRSWKDCSGASCRNTRRSCSICSAGMAISGTPWMLSGEPPAIGHRARLRQCAPKDFGT